MYGFLGPIAEGEDASLLGFKAGEKYALIEGHSGPDTTYRFYAQLQSDTVFEELDRMFMTEGPSEMSKIASSKTDPDRTTFLIQGENISAG
ncbi:MAG: hypothetical protein LUO79_00895 [Methanomassiliicoccales archaeon]|nr:hypothetical protein [Methanomassiliicoccales archaeon]